MLGLLRLANRLNSKKCLIRYCNQIWYSNIITTLCKLLVQYLNCLYFLNFCCGIKDNIQYKNPAMQLLLALLWCGKKNWRKKYLHKFNMILSVRKFGNSKIVIFRYNERSINKWVQVRTPTCIFMWNDVSSFDDHKTIFLSAKCSAAVNFRHKVDFIVSILCTLKLRTKP